MDIRWLRIGIVTGIAMLGSLLTPRPALAVQITLQLVQSFTRSSPFGLASDGTRVFYTSGVGSNVVHELLPATGLDTGQLTTFTGFGSGALAWTGSQIATSNGSQIRSIDLGTGANAQTVNVSGVTGGGLIDGLDFDNNQWWWSPDVSNVWRLNANGSNALGVNVPFLGGAGGFSGVERVDVGANTFIIVVNDASNPRQLCVHDLSAALIGCTTLANSRYEDLAFDGRYLYAADVFGNRIDQIDILCSPSPGEPQDICRGSIFVPPGVPEPASVALLGTGLLSLVIRRRRGAKRG